MTGKNFGILVSQTRVTRLPTETIRTSATWQGGTRRPANLPKGTELLYQRSSRPYTSGTQSSLYSASPVLLLIGGSWRMPLRIGTFAYDVQETTGCGRPLSPSDVSSGTRELSLIWALRRIPDLSTPRVWYFLFQRRNALTHEPWTEVCGTLLQFESALFGLLTI